MPTLKWPFSLPGPATSRYLRTILRSLSDRISPPRQLPFSPEITRRQRRLLEAGSASPRQLCPISFEERPGQVPTVVVGGFVPGPEDATFLQRRIFLNNGSTYHLAFSPTGFHGPLFEAQMNDLIEELSLLHGTPPVVVAISYGAGLVLHWLRHQREMDASPLIAGLVLVSPVACVDDLIDQDAPKPATLLGRLVKGFIDLPPDAPEEKYAAWVEKSKQVMVKMFESGVQNKEALRQVLSRSEVLHVRDRVVENMRATTGIGAGERIGSLVDMPSPLLFTEDSTPLTDAPALILYAEKESSIMIDSAPTRGALQHHTRRLLPNGEFILVQNPEGSPVQHASLLFHCYNFNPLIARFYDRVRTGLPAVRRFHHTLARMVRPARLPRAKRPVDREPAPASPLTSLRS